MYSLHREKQLQFYLGFSYTSIYMVINDATSLMPLAHEWNSMFKADNIQSMIPKGSEKSILKREYLIQYLIRRKW